MIITYLGNFSVSHSTETHVAISLAALGHQVVRVQENATSPAEILAACERADLFLWTRTWVHDYMPAVLAELGRRGVTTVAYHLDLWLSLPRGADAKNNPFLVGTDFLFTPEGDNAAEYAALRRNWFFLPPAVVHTEVARGSVRPEWAGKIVFAGTGTNYHAEYPFRGELLAWLGVTYVDGFLHVPSGVRGAALNDLYASAAVVIGDSLNINFRFRWYVSDRLTESLGRGAILVWPQTEVARHMGFEDGVHLIYYAPGNIDSLRWAIYRALLLKPAERVAMITAAQAQILASHTYAHRMAELLATVAVAKK